jgi:hypothetical protein
MVQISSSAWQRELESVRPPRRPRSASDAAECDYGADRKLDLAGWTEIGVEIAMSLAAGREQEEQAWASMSTRAEESQEEESPAWSARGSLAWHAWGREGTPCGHGDDPGELGRWI